MGTTLSANPMQFACLRATLSEVMTPGAYAHMEQGGGAAGGGAGGAITAARRALACGAGGRAGGIHLRARPLAQRGRGRAGHQPQVEAGAAHDAA
jgi:glutamate-1-semialdehyde 2,1-aminomutase